jgi:hypothetical protein
VFPSEELHGEWTILGLSDHVGGIIGDDHAGVDEVLDGGLEPRLGQTLAVPEVGAEHDGFDPDGLDDARHVLLGERRDEAVLAEVVARSCVDSLIPASLRIDGPLDVWMTLGTSIFMMSSSSASAPSGSANEMNGGVKRRFSSL